MPQKSNDLKLLNDRRRNSGLSVFAFSLSLSDEEADPENWNLSSSDIETYPLAFFCIWFRYFFDYSDGGDFRKCLNTCLERVGCPGAELTVKNRWGETLLGDLNEESFKSQCWLVSRKGRTGAGTERGATSELWRGLRLCLQKERNERFMLEAYEDAPDIPSYRRIPEFLKKLIADYNNNRQKGNGKDFAEFVQVFKGDGDIVSDQDAWYSQRICIDSSGEKCSLLEKCSEIFNSEANVDVYLYYQGDGEEARYVLGIDYIRNNVPKIRKNGDRIKFNQSYCDHLCVQLQPGDKLTFNGRESVCPELQESAVYIQYGKNDRRDSRRFWWRQVPREIPYHKSRILFLLPLSSSEEEIRRLFEHNGIKAQIRFKQHVRINGDCRNLCVVTVEQRPSNAVTLRIADETDITFSGPTPDIEIDSGCISDIFPDEHFDAVCSSNCTLRFSGKNADSSTCFSWKATHGGIVKSGEDKDFSVELKSSLPVSVLSLSCDISFGEKGEKKIKRTRTVFVLSQSVVDAVRKGKGKPDGWSVAGSEDIHQRIVDRLGGWNRKIISSQERSYEVFTADTGWFHWFKREKECDTTPERHFSSTELTEWEICIPDDLRPQLTVSKAGDQPINLNCSWRRDQEDGYFFCKLADLLSGRMTAEIFRYDSDDQRNDRYEIRQAEKLLFTGETKPTKPELCLDKDNQWGVYLPPWPQGRPRTVWVGWFSDHWKRLDSPIIKDIHSQPEDQYPKFVPLNDWLAGQDQSEEEARCEQFLALYSRKPGRKLEHITSAVSLHKIREARNCLRDIYQSADIRWYQEEWGKELQGHIFSALSRIMNTEIHDPMLPEQYFPLWQLEVLERKRYDKIARIMTYMLEDGYDFLAEPEWFFQDFPRRQCDEFKKSFLDNRDRKSARNIGKGLCAALIGQWHIDQYDALQDSEVRELTRLSSTKQAISDLGIWVECQGMWQGAGRYRFPIFSAQKQRQGRREYLSFEIFRKPRDIQPVNEEDGDYRNQYPPNYLEFDLKGEKHWKCDKGYYQFKCFVVDKPIFAQRKIEFDVSSELKFLIDEQEENCCINLFEILNKMKGSDRLTSCTKDFISAIVEYLYSEECPDEYKQDCDYRVILLTGLILCVNLTVCRNDTPEGWFFARESNEYKRVNSIVLDLFNHRDTQEGTVEWRSLMRIMCAFMGLFSYFNRGAEISVKS